MKKVIRDNYRVEITPDPWRSGLSHDQMRGLLADLEKGVKRHVDGVDGVTQRWDTREECSHCGYAWETLSATDVKNPKFLPDEHSVEGEPVCCEAGINEFRAERGIPALAETGGA
ncbi:hypothetical protein ABZ330_00145 [Streptomyces sp. NPDC006172]|uniref:hypothetical protein n=1 Tax=Streptomyces sp. NPDC006172 TaxID=3154470 RepID=UPI0033DD767A